MNTETTSRTEELKELLERLGDETRPVRNISIAALSDVPRSEAPLFRAAWASYGPERRLELVTELVEQAEANVHLNFTAILRDLLNDVDPHVRKLAIEGLWEDNRPTLVPVLAALATRDTESEVRAAAAESLGRFVLLGSLGEIAENVAEQAVQALYQAWQRPNEATEVRRRALEGLAFSGGRAVSEMIQSAYFDEDPLMRQSAVFAMGRSSDRRWARTVLEELASRDAPMRFEAATAAGELALPAAVAPLVALLEDADSSVREAAALALGQIGGPQARRALETAANGDDERLAEAAEDALEELEFNSGASADVLFDFTDVAHEGLQPALAGIGDPEAALALSGDDDGMDDIFEDGDDEDEFDEDLDDDLDDDEEDDEEGPSRTKDDETALWDWEPGQDSGDEDW